MNHILSALYQYRGFILGSVKRECQAKYHSSMIGAAWLVIQPLAMIAVYTLIFSRIMHSRLPGTEASKTFAYSVYLCSGVLTWGFFAEMIARGQSVFIDNANLIKKLNFPKICLPAIFTLSALFNFSIIFGLFTLFLILSGNFPGWIFWGVLPLLVVQMLFALSLSIILGILNVFFRDVGQFTSILLQFWFWFTPIVYPITVLPQWAQSLLRFNPMASLMEGYQSILVKGVWPTLYPIMIVFLVSCVLSILAFALFRRHAGEMMDEL